MSERYVLGLDEVDETFIGAVGGKGANLGALRRIEGVRVPPGFCVTTAAFERADGPAVPDEVAAAIRERVEDGVAYAVRSSATAEDLPTASFAGQQDSFLNVVGADAVVEHVGRCWASLGTERAVAYREHNGIDSGAVRMAVVVQRMVQAQAAGVLFTADPLSGNRTVARVEAVHGLGDALVSGRVDPDAPGAVLTEAQTAELVRLGRRIEAYFGRPQDIEWCLDADGFQVVQSRPITTLFPVPATGDDEHHVYLSVGHQQMMTDAMKPLGLSFWQMTTPAPMAEAGGRLFVDVTQRVATPGGRAALLELIGKGDPLTGDALRSVLERDGYIREQPDAAAPPPLLGGPTEPIETDPAIVAELIAATDASIAAAALEIRGKTGADLLDFIQADIQELRRVLFDRRGHRVYMSAMEATWWLNEHIEARLGEKNVADTLSQSVPDNVTSEMGLALLDVADVVRAHPGAVAVLEDAGDDFLERLPEPVRAAIEAWLDRYGMRCAGEIDITRPRWRERPSTLVPLLLGNVRNFEPGESRRRFEQGRLEALAKAGDVVERLRALPDGDAEQTQAKIELVRTFIGYREYPKYGMVSRYWIYKRALLDEAGRLAARGVIGDPEDIYFLTFAELRDVVRTGRADAGLIAGRREEFRTFQALTPSRVLTSDGEGLNGSYHRGDVPAGALLGLPVSAGTVEGRARVILDMAAAVVEPGDILVTAYTDPSWTPLFVAIAGLVTEVGGVMTHGAVVAREYGLPAVVGVVGATRLIPDGQRIRVHGTEGYIELLP
ncbi:phosphoenolpyruvate synthase [Dactylosporangium matsuzakiense]|uniref:Phosphoenolpyruvate synthase n=1 Tax=Dactylosporangium matsuzakiense TaxID=53360 RepID=A0A9W6NL99_9ACTN|nr:phosphoenolpyruvate synthase [Dactylosporangium matsuzakiense]UWZ48637.1 phosphoenolpyruvate synthase [Dactylosporangium matsuzakiense]GLL00657.1 phosphoenolpyruvate synthase [Dactylosporangium matsuzakiense]